MAVEPVAVPLYVLFAIIIFVQIAKAILVLITHTA